MSKHLTASFTIPTKSAGTPARPDDSKRKRFASENFFESSISLSPNFWIESTSRPVFGYHTFSLCLFGPESHGRYLPRYSMAIPTSSFSPSFPLWLLCRFWGFCSVGEGNWTGEKYCDAHGVGTILMGDKFKGVGVNELVTEEESYIFFFWWGRQGRGWGEWHPHWATLTFWGWLWPRKLCDANGSVTLSLGEKLTFS